MKTIELSQGYVAKVSDEDFARVVQYKWTVSREGCKGLKLYAIRWSTKAEHGSGKRFKIRLHRFILDVPPGTLDSRIVHHKDDDGLNCQRENLFLVETNHQNMCYSPGWNRPKAIREEPWL